jgi:hypothetical protein
MEIKQISDVLLEVRIPYGEDVLFFLGSDFHYDNPKCQRDKLHKHLDYVAERNGKIFVFGDFFCMMQGKYDPRSSKKDIRPEHNTSNYIDAVIEDTIEKFKDYPISLISKGNHELGLLNRLETDVIKRFVDGTNLYKGPEEKVYAGGYHGFIKFVLHRNGANVKTYLMYYHHGLWGGVVSRGFQAYSRYGVVTDADFVVSGHTHDRSLAEIMRYDITKTGNLLLRPQYFIKSGTYKEEYAVATSWAVEKLGVPKNIGGWYLEIKGTDRDNISIKINMT